MSKTLILSSSERTTLEEIYRNYPKPYLRNRAQCLLLRSDGLACQSLSKFIKHATYPLCMGA